MALVLLAALGFLGLEAPDARAAGTAAPSGESLTGVVQLALEHFDDKTVRRQPILVTRQGAVGLRLPLDVPAATGRAMTVSRIKRDDRGMVVAGDVRMYGAAGEPTAFGAPLAISDGSVAFSPGPRKVVVILVELSQGAAVVGAEAARTTVFTGTPSANSYFQEQTAGLVSLTGKQRTDGDVYGPYPVTVFSNSCAYTQWSEDADQAFYKQTKTWPFNVYDHVIYVFRAPQCQFSGVGVIGLQPGARTWINGDPTVAVVSHELGHNFGADHANSLNCVQSGARVSFGGACSVTEYGDPFDVMGQGGTQHETAYHKWESGWLPADNVLRVSKNGAYLVTPLEGTSSGVQLLEVPRGPGLESYWIDFRQPFGTLYDAYEPSSPIVNGIGLRMMLRPDPAKPAQKTKLVDTTPQTTTFADAPLAAGRTYAEPAKGITITTLSASVTGALVLIKLPGGTDALPPSAPAGISGAVQGGKVTLAWGGASDDSGEVTSYRISRNGATLAETPGTTIDDTPPAALTHHYEVRALDPSGNPGPPVSIDLFVPDVTAPGAPPALVVQLGTNEVRLMWQAAPDDVGVASYLVQRDGQIVADVAALAYTVAGLKSGSVHSFAVRARDSAGNAGAPAGPVTVTVAGTAAAKSATQIKRRAVKHVRARIVDGKVLVSWPKVKGALRYEVLRDAKVVAKTRLTHVTQRPKPLAGHRYTVRALLRVTVKAKV